MTNMKKRGAARSGMLMAFASVPALVVAMQAAPAYAQGAAQSFDIPAQPLENALVQFANQTGVQLIYSADVARGLRSAGVSGSMTPQQAIARLLAGTGLSVRVTSSGTMTIERQSATGDVAAADGERVLGPVRVEGSQADGYQSPVRGDGIAKLGGVRGGQDDEVVGYRPKVVSVSTGTPVAIEDVPRSLTVQTQEQIEKQDILTLEDSLNKMPGITVSPTGFAGSGSREAEISSRGYNITAIQVDGGAPLSLGASGGLANLDAYERVELVRGPNAIFGGAGSVGGSINLVRKRPGPSEALIGRVSAGSFDRVSIVADASVPSIAGTPIAFRGVASVHREGAPEDYDRVTTSLYGIFDVPLGEDGRLEFGGQYSHVDQDGDYLGLPRYISGEIVDLPRRFNMAPSDVFRVTDSNNVFAKLYVTFLENWNLETGISLNSENTKSRIFSPSLALLPSGNALFPTRFASVGYRGGSNSTTIDAKLTGSFETFFLRHDVFANLSFAEDRPRSPLDLVGEGQVADIFGIADVLNPAYLPVDGYFDYVYSGSRNSNFGIVVGDTLSWDEKVFLTITARKDAVSVNNFIFQAPGGTTATTYSGSTDQPDSSSWRPSFSAVVKPFEGLSLYGSYADGFVRQDNFFSRSGEAGAYQYRALAPVRYSNKEIGLKYAWGKSLLSIAMFDLTERGRGVQIQPILRACPPIAISSGLSSACYGTETATQRSRGIDLEFTGEPIDGLRIVASANYLDTEIIGSNVPLLTLAPKYAGRLYVDWAPSFVPGASVQFGARYRGRIYTDGFRQFYDQDDNPVGDPEAFEIDVPSFLTLDLGVEYKLSSFLSARITVDNLTNKRFFETVSSSTDSGNFPARPRSYLATLIWTGGRGDASRSTNGRAPFGDPSDWYAAFGYGVMLGGNMKGKAAGLAQDGATPVRWTFENKQGSAFAARVGYHITDNVRTELGGSYRHSQFGNIGGALVAPFGVCGAEGAGQGTPFDCDDAQGGIRSWIFSANAIYDFGERDAIFRPFIGAGVGVASNGVNFSGKMEGIGLDTPWQIVTIRPAPRPPLISVDTVRTDREIIGGDDQSAALYLTASLGGSIKINDRLHIEGAWSYSLIPNMKWASYNLDFTSGARVPLTPRVGTFHADYGVHSLSIGLRWAFGSK